MSVDISFDSYDYHLTWTLSLNSSKGDGSIMIKYCLTDFEVSEFLLICRNPIFDQIKIPASVRLMNINYMNIAFSLFPITHLKYFS